MPSRSLSIRPGVDTVKTPALNEAGITASNLIRFREGLVEKKGGWTLLSTTALTGVPRDMVAWYGDDAQAHLAIGTTGELAILTGSSLLDVTPGLATSNLTNCFSTVAGSNVVTVTDPNYSPYATDMVTIPEMVAVGGLILIGTYAIRSTISATQYTIQAVSNATATVNNGGSVPVYNTTVNFNTVTVTLPLSYYTSSTYTANFKVVVAGLMIYGPYPSVNVDSNTFTITLPQVANATTNAASNGGMISLAYTSNPSFLQARKAPNLQRGDWTLCSYGSQLLAYPLGGPLYVWDARASFPTAQQVQGAPGGMAAILVYDRAQMVVGYGSVKGSYAAQNIVRWSAAGDYTTWTASSTNLAGSFPIPSGSGIVGAALFGTSILIWTDIDLYLMQYVGGNDVWGFNKIASGCGLIGQHAWAQLGPAVYWMSQNAFWMTDGQSVQMVPCPLFDDIFPKLSSANVSKVRGLANSGFGEVGWSFPSAAGSGENDKTVLFNASENAWDLSALGRSAWIDQSALGPPIGADASGNIFQHETSPDAAGAPMPSSFTTGWFLIDEGETFSFVDFMRPDVKFPNGVGTLQVTVLSCVYTTDIPVQAGPYTITAATEYINMRCRGRYIAFVFASSDLGSFWRIGRPQVRWAASGKR